MNDMNSMASGNYAVSGERVAAPGAGRPLSSNSLVSKLLDAVYDFLKRSHGVYGPEINRLARAAERVKKATLEPPVDCAGCAEFVRMQHNIASLLGVDEDTDSIDLHGRIYEALSTRAAQPPAGEVVAEIHSDTLRWVVDDDHPARSCGHANLYWSGPTKEVR